MKARINKQYEIEELVKDARKDPAQQYPGRFKG